MRANRESGEHGTENAGSCSGPKGEGLLKKFLDPKQIERALGDVVTLAKEQRADIALVGGVAMQLHGSDRLTVDVDFVADKELDGLQDSRRLNFGGTRGKTPSGIPVDVIVRNDSVRSLYEEALKRAPVHEGIVKVVGPEYLAAMKLDAGRLKDEQDLQTLLMLDVLDKSEAREIIERHLGSFAAKDFDSHVYEIEWRLAKERDGR